jgi:hypothetical protein
MQKPRLISRLQSFNYATFIWLYTVSGNKQGCRGAVERAPYEFAPLPETTSLSRTATRLRRRTGSERFEDGGAVA